MNARLAIFVAAIAFATAIVNAHPTVVPRDVHRSLAATGKVDLIVTMKTKTKVIENFHEAAYASRGAAITALKKQLETAHEKALSPLTNLFVQESTSDLDIKTFWISPVASVRGATIEVIEKIAALPAVLSVREARTHDIPKLTRENADVKSVQGHEWNIARINAPQVWADGNTGQGIRVGMIDTGVRSTHEALSKTFGGAYSWFDPQFNSAAPYDDVGHGTHVMGIIAGANGVGVAPGATWMACRGLNEDGFTEQELLDCAQFMLCPTDTDGNNPDCSKAPRVINNSWSFEQGDDWYNDAVSAWVKAGIVPVFSSGNTGPKCGTAKYPADHPMAIGVGATSYYETLAPFSSKGPTIHGLLKPDISAPGLQVRSAMNTSDTAFEYHSGTSMAAPHITGSIALLLQGEPDLTVDQVRSRLISTTVQAALLSDGFPCGNLTETSWPNHEFGYGRVNIFDAYQGFRTTPAPTAMTSTP